MTLCFIRLLIRMLKMKTMFAMFKPTTALISLSESPILPIAFRLLLFQTLSPLLPVLTDMFLPLQATD